MMIRLKKFQPNGKKSSCSISRILWICRLIERIQILLFFGKILRLLMEVVMVLYEIISVEAVSTMQLPRLTRTRNSISQYAPFLGFRISERRPLINLLIIMKRTFWFDRNRLQIILNRMYFLN